jgi:hypothetical protein
MAFENQIKWTGSGGLVTFVGAVGLYYSVLHGSETTVVLSALDFAILYLLRAAGPADTAVHACATASAPSDVTETKKL